MMSRQLGGQSVSTVNIQCCGSTRVDSLGSIGRRCILVVASIVAAGLLAGTWGPCTDCAGDLNGDGVVDGADVGALLGCWTG